MKDQDYHLVLAHLFPQKTYRDFVRGLRGHKILDNGAAEEQTVFGKDVIEAAWTWEVAEVVVPDVPGNYFETWQAAREFEKFVVPDFKYMGVAQGNDMSEVMACINGFSFLEYITVLGLPRSLCIEHRMNRYYLAEIMTERWGSRFNAIHILGSSWWLREVVALTELPLVRGIDTSMPIKMGLHNIDIARTDEHYNTFPTQEDFFNIEAVGSSQEEYIARNVNTFRSWAASSPVSSL